MLYCHVQASIIVGTVWQYLLHTCLKALFYYVLTGIPLLTPIGHCNYICRPVVLTYAAELNLLDILESAVVFICNCMLVPSGPNIYLMTIFG